MTRLCVLEANAPSPTEYDSKGYGPLRLAGRTLALVTVERPALGSTASLGRPAFSHTPSLTHNFVTHQLSHLVTYNFVTHTHTHTPSSTHTTLSHRTLSHTHTTLSQTIFVTHHHLSHTIFVTHHLSHTIFVTHHLCHTQLFTYNRLTDRSSHHLLCLSFLHHPTGTFVSASSKKLTCGVVRSFNFCFGVEIPFWSFNFRRHCT